MVSHRVVTHIEWSHIECSHRVLTHRVLTHRVLTHRVLTHTLHFVFTLFGVSCRDNFLNFLKGSTSQPTNQPSLLRVHQKLPTQTSGLQALWFLGNPSQITIPIHFTSSVTFHDPWTSCTNWVELQKLGVFPPKNGWFIINGKTTIF